LLIQDSICSRSLPSRFRKPRTDAREAFGVSVGSKAALRSISNADRIPFHSGHALPGLIPPAAKEEVAGATLPRRSEARHLIEQDTLTVYKAATERTVLPLVIRRTTRSRKSRVEARAIPASLRLASQVARCSRQRETPCIQSNGIPL
jgi:hypothetical protein